MNIFWIVILVSAVVWLLPLFKQFRTEYFHFFLVLSLSDVVVIPIAVLFRINPQIMYPIFAALLILSLKKIKKMQITLLFIITGVLIFLCLKLDPRLLYILYSFYSSAILLIILYQFLQYIMSNNSVSIFFIFLIAYELSLVLKNIVVYTNILQGVTLFSITTFFEIGFGIIFTFVNVNTKVYKLPVKDIE